MSPGHKATIITTIIGVAITAVVSLYIHFDSPEIDVLGTVSERGEVDSNDEAPTKSPTINIADIFITPIDTKMPTNFFVEISNTGTETAKDIQLTVDFGESTIELCELQPASIASTGEREALSIQSFKISELREDASFYVSCAINLPYFNKIWVGGGNIRLDKSLDYDSYKDLKLGKSIGFYEIIWRVILIFIIFILALKTIGFLFTKI